MFVRLFCETLLCVEDCYHNAQKCEVTYVLNLFFICLFEIILC